MKTYYKYIKDNPLFYNDVEIAKYGDIIVYDKSIGYQNITTGININTQAAMSVGLESMLDTTELSPAFSIDIKENNTNKDNVNHPKHYTQHPSGIECIEITQWYNFCIGNAIKYLWRNGIKTEQGMSNKEKQIEDLRKAIWYINQEIKRLENT